MIYNSNTMAGKVKMIQCNVFDNVNIPLLCAIFFFHLIKHDRSNTHIPFTLVSAAKMNPGILNVLSLKSNLHS
jgi:hypothetical protein